MASVQLITEMLARIKDGETCSTRDWDNRVVPKTVRKILKQYDIEHSYNKDVPVNQDMALADRFYLRARAPSASPDQGRFRAAVRSVQA